LSKLPIWMLAGGLLYGGVGCQSTELTLGQKPFPPERLVMSSERREFAEALALFSEGLIHEMHKDFDAALSSYRQAIALDPENEELYFRLAMGLLHERRNEEAVYAMEQLAERRPRSPKVMRWLALIYRAADHPKKSIETYERWIDLQPDEPDPYIQLASLYVKEGRDREAIGLLEEAIPEVNEPEKLLRAMGDIYLRRSLRPLTEEEEQANREAAIDILERILETDANDLFVLNKLGELYIQSGRMGKAIGYYERIEELNPDDLGVKKRLAESFLQMGETGKAVEMLQNIADREPYNSRVLFYLGELYQQLGDEERAIESFKRAVQVEPSDPAGYLKLALLQMNRDPEGAAESLNRGLKHIPRDRRLLEMLAYVYLGREQYEEAVDYFARALEQAEGEDDVAISPNLYLNYAVAAQRVGQIDRAAELLNEAMDENGSFVDTYVGFIFRREEEKARASAASVIERVLKTRPDDPRLHYYLGLIRSAQEEYETAMDAFAAAENNFVEGAVREELMGDFYLNYSLAAQRAGYPYKAAELLAEGVKVDFSILEAYVQSAFREEEDEVKRLAAEVLDHAAAIRPDDAAIAYYQGVLYNYLKEYEQAVGSFARAEDLAMGSRYEEALISPQFYFWYGAALERTGDLGRAADLFYRCIELNPNHAEAYNYIAYMWAEKGMHLDQALELVNTALSIEPDSGAFVDTLGWIYYMQGKYEAALEEIERAAELLPDDPTIIDHLGDVLLKLGAVEKAVPKWKRSFVLDPDNHQVAEKLTEHGVDLQPLRDKARALQAEDDDEGPASDPEIGQEDLPFAEERETVIERPAEETVPTKSEKDEPGNPSELEPAPLER